MGLPNGYELKLCEVEVEWRNGEHSHIGQHLQGRTHHLFSSASMKSPMSSTVGSSNSRTRLFQAFLWQVTLACFNQIFNSLKKRFEIVHSQYFLLSGIFSGFHLSSPSLWRLFVLYCLFSAVIFSLKIGI